MPHIYIDGRIFDTEQACATWQVRSQTQLDGGVAPPTRLYCSSRQNWYRHDRSGWELLSAEYVLMLYGSELSDEQHDFVIETMGIAGDDIEVSAAAALQLGSDDESEESCL